MGKNTKQKPNTKKVKWLTVKKTGQDYPFFHHSGCIIIFLA
jgi:hypothetical protein